MRLNVSFHSRLALLVGSAVAVPTLFACLEHPLKPVEYEAQQEKQDSIALTVNKDVDILFVIDNSGSMAEEQATLAANFSSFIEVLERPEVQANYRIGITTTDNGNPWCTGTGPEGGKLVLSSCRSRTQDFVFQGAMMVDATQEACLDVCPAEWENIAIQPTAADVDDQMIARPWIENIEGATNLPEGLDTVTAFQCLGPQGINGCGFEEQLESMYKALRRATTDGEESYGFLRNNAILSVVQLTDEVDCSFNKDLETIFLPDGNRVFWSNPDEGAPTSAVCWNAGVECTGSGTYDECHSVNLNVDGQVIDSDDPDTLDAEAVLRPVSRYTDFVQGFETQKQMITPDQQVLFALIAGVNSDGSITYADTQADPAFQTDFGIGPGCQSAAGTAVPPVRMAEFANAFKVGDAQNMFSICNDSYSAALEAIAEAIADQVKPACMPACVSDTDQTTDPLDAQCTLIQEAPQDDGTLETTTIEACDGTDVPEGENVCYVALIDGARDANGDRVFLDDDASNDMSDFCADAGWNLEFILIRREGFPAPGGTAVKATCQLSQSKQIECPALP